MPEPALDVLLQECESFRRRMLLEFIAGRFFIIGLMITISISEPFYGLFLISALASIFLCILWQTDTNFLSDQLRAIEEKVALQSSEEWRDAYIKSRYSARYSKEGVPLRLQRLLFEYEPMIWLLLSMLIVVITSLRPHPAHLPV